MKSEKCTGIVPYNSQHTTYKDVENAGAQSATPSMEI